MSDLSILYLFLNGINKTININFYIPIVVIYVHDFKPLWVILGTDALKGRAMRGPFPFLSGIHM